MNPHIANLVRRTFTAVTGIKPRSLQSNLKLREDVAYSNLGVTVTADWLELEQTSYSIRHLRKITRQILPPPRLEAGIVFLFSILLIIWQVLRILDDSESTALNVFLLILCVLLFFASSYICFVKRTVYRLDIVVAYEKKPLKILRETKADLDDLNDAMLEVMENYRNNLGCLVMALA